MYHCHCWLHSWTHFLNRAALHIVFFFPENCCAKGLAIQYNIGFFNMSYLIVPRCWKNRFFCPSRLSSGTTDLIFNKWHLFWRFTSTSDCQQTLKWLSSFHNGTVAVITQIVNSIFIQIFISKRYKPDLEITNGLIWSACGPMLLVASFW